MIKKIHLRQFRNYTDNIFSFTKPTTIITGVNGSGKTNLLESIFVSCFTKSFRTTDLNLIKHGCDFFTLTTNIDKFELNLQFKFHDGHRSKKLKVNNTTRPLSYIIGKFPVVLFDPNILDLFTTLPSSRRKYLDTVLCQTKNSYLKKLSDYKKILKQKNSLLRKAKKEPIQNLNEQLFVLNLQIVEPSLYITKSRMEFLSKMKDEINYNYQLISGSSEDIIVKFISQYKTKNDLIKQLEQSVKNDIAIGFSTIGAHRDDFKIHLKKLDVSTIASRGELRSLVLACKFTELNYIENSLNIKPTLLLDDVLSELDEQRQKFLLKNLGKYQSIITTTHLPSNINLDYCEIKL